MGVTNQFLATFAVAYLTFLIGLIYAWPSYTLNVFLSERTPLSRRMTETEAALVGSLANVGGVLSTPFCGIFMDRLGRKYASMLYGIPFVIGWAIISVTTNVYLVIFAMFLSGITAGGQTIATVYIAELAQDSIRGGLCTFTAILFNSGLLVSYLLGGTFDYRGVTYAQLMLAVLHLVMLSFLQDTPISLLRKGDEKSSMKSLAFYRNATIDSKLVQEEMQQMRRILQAQADLVEIGKDVEDKLLDNPNQQPAVVEKDKWASWKFLAKSSSSQRALITNLLLMAASVFSGATVLPVYAEKLFLEAVPSMSPTLCSIILALDLLVAGIISAFITDRTGRKTLTIFSAAASGLCMAALASQICTPWAPHWLTAAFIYLFNFSFSVGAANTPYVLSAEVFLPEVKSICTVMVFQLLWFCNFLVLFIFPPLVDIFTLGGVFYMFSIICFLTSLYSIFYLPETKGLPADAIQILFMKQR